MSLARAGTALFGAVALCGCYRSAIPLAPDADLTAVTELAPGRYCAAGPDWDGAIRLDDDDCRTLAFDAERRIYVETRDWENADWSLEHRVVRLAPGYYLTQVDEPDREELPYTFVPFIATTGGFAAIGDAGEDGFGVFAQAYADVEVRRPDRFGAGDILSGDLQRARVLVELAARSDLAAWLAGGGDPDGVAVYVRVEEGDGQDAIAARYAAVVSAARSDGPAVDGDGAAP